MTPAMSVATWRGLWALARIFHGVARWPRRHPPACRYSPESTVAMLNIRAVGEPVPVGRIRRVSPRGGQEHQTEQRTRSGPTTGPPGSGQS